MIQKKLKIIHLATVVLALIGMLFVLWLQYYRGMFPCPLCILQRVLWIAIGLVSLSAFFVSRQIWLAKCFLVMNIFFACLGLLVSGRQVYLQHLPPESVPACLPDLATLLNLLPLQKVVQIIFQGSGDCALVHKIWFGFSLAEISFAGFVFIFILFLFTLIFFSRFFIYSKI